MRKHPLPKVKICCISSIDEANRAIAAGASAIGLVSSMPSGPGVIDDELIADIAGAVPPPIATFLLTARQQADAIIEQHQLCLTSTIQLVDKVDIVELRKLRLQLPGVRLVQVIHVIDEESVAEAVSLSSEVDALLLDSGNPNLEIKELGGTGRVHDWRLSRRICGEALAPVFLAGGLNADNVSQAIESARPWGLDLCSSVRTNGVLDESKLNKFFKAVNDHDRQ